MRATTLTPALSSVPTLERVHPSLALRARLGASLSLSWGRAAFCLDATMLALAVGAALLGARFGGQTPSLEALALFPVLCLVLYHAAGLYSPRLMFDAVEDGKTIVLRTGVAAMAVLALQLLVNLNDTGSIAAHATVRAWLFATVYVAAGRIALYWSQVRARRAGDVMSSTLIVGRSDVARLVARRLIEHRDLGLLPIGYVELGAEPARVRDGEVPIPVLGSTDDLPRLVEQFDVTQVIVTASGASADRELVPVITRCEELGIAVAYVPSLHEKIGTHLRVEHIGALPLVTAYATDPAGWQFAVKYAFDRLVAAAILLALSPVMLLSAAAVYATMGRPLFFRQTRIGRDGRAFDILKFRSMRLAPARVAFQLAEGSAPGGVEGEDRRTPVGTFLRKSSLDELPQLFNVLRGEMSLVGPRPERPEFVDRFTHDVYRYGQRHRVKSGITGWAQVHGLRGQTSIADRAEWDNWYIENFSLWLDLKILLMTAGAVFKVFKTVE